MSGVSLLSFLQLAKGSSTLSQIPKLVCRCVKELLTVFVYLVSCLLCLYGVVAE